MKKNEPTHPINFKATHNFYIAIKEYQTDLQKKLGIKKTIPEIIETLTLLGLKQLTLKK
jgi:hypothetical protein